LFEQGRADLTPEGRKAVQALAAVLKHIKNGIEIVGHADPVQPRENVSKNWELSLSRALAVSGILSTEGYTRSLPIKGYGSSLYASLPESLPEDRRQAISRRVDIIINHHNGTAQQRFGIGQ
jgi:flagellar motor protein MotB